MHLWDVDLWRIAIKDVGEACWEAAFDILVPSSGLTGTYHRLLQDRVRASATALLP